MSYLCVPLFTPRCIPLSSSLGLPEPHERPGPPAEDDGDPTHVQRLSGHPDAPRPGFAAGRLRRQLLLQGRVSTSARW